MDSGLTSPTSAILFLILIISILIPSTFSAPSPSSSSSINSNSILVTLLDDSHYTEFSELVEKANLLQTLETTISKHHHNITIFAPINEALRRDLDPDFKRFLLEPRNLRSLQHLLLHHIVYGRVHSDRNNHRLTATHHRTLSNGRIRLSVRGNRRLVEEDVELVNRYTIVRPDGAIHGIEKVLVPQSVIEDFNRRRNLRSISAVHPEGAPVVDPRTNKLKKKTTSKSSSTPTTISIYEAMAPGPSLAPASAPSPGGPNHHFDGETQVKDFITTLLHYGGYNEMADILVNLTSLATEIGKLVSEGYVITVLAPNDEAMAKLTTDQLSEPGAPEMIMYYHIIPEYQTEESMYNAVRRFGKVKYDTLRLPFKVVAEEADGSVKFDGGEKDGVYLFDPDIYTDGRISVQGIDGVLFPMTEKGETAPAVKKKVAVAKQPRRGKLLEVTCQVLGVLCL